MSLAVSIGSDSISIYVDGDFYSVDKTHANYPELLRELRKQPRDLEAIMQLVEMPRFISKITSGRVEIGEEAVLFSGEPVSGYMVERLMAMATAGDEVASWATFMDNLMDNPHPGVREDLYKWMEAGRLPITQDGCIVAFKKVRANYTDCHTGKFSNAVGAVLEMDRSLCDTSRKNTCSTGFHFCSAGYLSHFSGDRVMVVKINPRDVTAIPNDYNNHKARCCRYVVTGELKSESAARHRVWSEKNVINLENPQELPEVLLPRKGRKLSEVEPDPTRAEGPAPIDDLAPPPDNSVSPPAPRKGAGSKPAEGVLVSRGKQFTPEQVAQAYASTDRKPSRAAKVLGVPKTTLLGWLKKLP